MNDYKSDIPLDRATAAHLGTSMVPEKRGHQEQDEYSHTLSDDLENLSKLANTDEKTEQLVQEFTRYRQGYRTRVLAYLDARSRCISILVTGPSNFPGRRNEKRNATGHRRLEELLEFRKRALAAIRKKLTPELQPVKSSDTDAVSRLTAKIEKAEKSQDLMKAANKIAKSNPKNEKTEEKIKDLENLGLTNQNAHNIFEKDYAGRVGFRSYELTNNNANIRRMKQRVEKISRDQATPETIVEGTAARLEDCPADNRVRLFFPGKPDAEIRTRLKRSGFRWTPSLGCWQAYRNIHALETARQEAEGK